jgi:hypothetical protein
MKAIGMIMVVMMVSGLRMMWRRDRPVSEGGVTEEVLAHRCSLLVGADAAVIAGSPSAPVAPTMARKTSSRVGCFSTYSTSGGRQELLELGEGAVGDDPPLAEDRDPVGEMFGLVQVLRGEQHRRALPASSLTLFHTSMRGCGSSPVVGSSRKITGGFPIRLMAMSSRRRMPPEYVATLRGRAGELEAGQQVIRDPAGVLHAPKPGHQDQVLAPGEDLVHGRELPVRLMDSRTFAGCVATSKPSTVAVPASA